MPITEHLLAAGPALYPLSTISKNSGTTHVMTSGLEKHRASLWASGTVYMKLLRPCPWDVQIPGWLLREKYQPGLHFWSSSTHIPKEKQSIFAHDQVNSEPAETQPYLSVLTFILFVFSPGPVAREELSLTYLHGQRA